RDLARSPAPARGRARHRSRGADLLAPPAAAAPNAFFKRLGVGHWSAVNQWWSAALHHPVGLDAVSTIRNRANWIRAFDLKSLKWHFPCPSGTAQTSAAEGKGGGFPG